MSIIIKLHLAFLTAISIATFLVIIGYAAFGVGIGLLISAGSMIYYGPKINPDA
ncbi:hypothetical protein KAR91_00615 [Candidatus Pacearchaeota archaeon]|nr:hypothetical protein [Candidatus Pacearchaeota archaeon]